ncbi:MAG: hypothetical protein IJ870_00445 [Alphaproteobacteria bacterium]|nr:hypothetical protein [Alphaproteobacteria bacterium]
MVLINMPQQNTQELEQNSARNMLAPLLENKGMLPRDIFDYQNEMHADIEAHIRRCLPFAKRELISFFKAPLEDVVCMGEICTPLHNSKSNIDIAFVVDTTLDDQILKNISVSLDTRGFVFKIYDHQMHFRVVKPKDLFRPNWSVMRHTWNILPQIRVFSYSLDDLLRAYTNLNNDFHAKLDNLEKNKAGFYTPQSCEVITKYFDNLEQRAKDTLQNHPEHEYALDYILFKALDIFGVRRHFRQTVAQSECYYLSGAEDDGV